MTTFRYLRADEWGIRWARPPLAERQLDPEAYVHHSAGAHLNDAVAAFKALNEYAINSKGYSALDYDILVHRDKRDGTVTIGGGREGYMSAATLDRNEQGEAICVLGYFHPPDPRPGYEYTYKLSRQPHPDEIEGVALGIVWGMEHGWIARDATILGHRDNPAHPGATGCPGDYLYAHLPTIRTRVAELLAPPPEEPVTVRYFKLAADGKTVWATSDGLTAVRLEGWQAQGRGVDMNNIPVLPAAEHDDYVYVQGFTSESVK